MKKLLALVLVLLMICGSAVAEIDWASMTDEEIEAALAAGEAELKARRPEQETDGAILIEDGLVLIDACDVTATVEEKPTLSYNFISFDVVIDNKTDKEMVVFTEDCSLNGWAVFIMGPGSAPAGKKYRGEISISVEDAGIKSLDEVEELSFTVRLIDDEEWETLYTTGEKQYLVK